MTPGGPGLQLVLLLLVALGAAEDRVELGDQLGLDELQRVGASERREEPPLMDAVVEERPSSPPSMRPNWRRARRA